VLYVLCFFFQAEDGIRDFHVTGVQTCALPIFQVGLLETDAFAALPEDTAVLLIHAINPYGFSHIRRVNEDNIDLNRNFRDFETEIGRASCREREWSTVGAVTLNKEQQ